MNYFVITNNPAVVERFSKTSERDVNRAELVVRESFRDVLCECRDRIHSGARLVSHPLSGSVKPWETPYRSVLLSPGTELDLSSVETIEQAMERYDTLVNQHTRREYPEQVYQDFQMVDASLLESAISSLRSAFL
ncbi:GrdX family protein [Dongshaea marina]|uniref:GrdX family protein n=1 Tax=Dongshaea marina TaxID=2047966 RepID=UPI000D3E0FD8|nr:GrdX family protein [Dongshaea marina]